MIIFLCGFSTAKIHNHYTGSYNNHSLNLTTIHKLNPPLDTSNHVEVATIKGADTPISNPNNNTTEVTEVKTEHINFKHDQRTKLKSILISENDIRFFTPEEARVSFEKQDYDYTWSVKQVAELYNELNTHQLSSKLQIKSIDCKSRICKIQSTPFNLEGKNDFFDLVNSLNNTLLKSFAGITINTFTGNDGQIHFDLYTLDAKNARSSTTTN